MGQAFGNTWWGGEWLKALTHIDYENRIPRGKSYAKQGAVKNVELKGNIIKAKVKGSRATPYTVTIEVPLFSRSDIDRLMEQLMQRPLLISKMLNRELDPEILSVCSQLGLQIFPRRWDDLDMDCTCPDWAVPCKHIAAVIYMMSLEIDNNPFLVFSMHGVDLLEELKKRNAGIERETVMDVPEMDSLLQKQPKKKGVDETIPEFHRIDFSRLHDITEPLANLLPKESSFYSKGGFQKVYLSEMKHIAKKARLIVNGKIPLPPDPQETLNNDFHRTDEVRFKIEEDNGLALIFNMTDFDGLRKLPSLKTLIDGLFNLPDDYITEYHPTLSAMHQAMLCALNLLANGAVVPQIVKLKPGIYTIRWLPASIDSVTADTVNTLSTIFPTELVTVRFLKQKQEYLLKNQTECVLSYLIGTLIQRLSTAENYGDRIRELFFKGAENKFDLVGETSVPGSIRSWLDRFFISQREFSLSLLVSESENNGFLLDAGIDIEGKTILLKEIVDDKTLGNKRFSILKELSLLASFITGLEAYINSNGSSPLFFKPAEFVPFLFETIPAIRLLGVKVMLPKSLSELIHPRASMRISKKQNDGKTYLRLDEMLQFDWQVALGNELVSLDEFLEMTRNAEGLIRFKQHYIYVTEADIAKITKAIEGRHPMSPSEMLQSALAESYESAKVEITDEVRRMIDELTAQSEIPVPQGINAVLRPYQERGYSWMYRNMRIGFGSIMADDMGLGKTLQVITLFQRMKDDGMLEKKHLLVVVPTSLVSNWQSELDRFAPQLTVFTYYGQQRSLEGFNSDIMLTTYGVLRSDTAKLKKLPWRAVVIDEAQNIKNADTAQSRAVRSIPADTRIAMSGTPVENRLSEFWSIMDFCNRGYLGTVKSFKDDYANPIQRLGDERLAERFRKITSPFLMRRLKTDKSIISDLPDKIEQNEFSLLTESQASLYHETLQHAMKAIEAVDKTDNKSLFERQGLVLQMILALKQICNHPALFLKNGDFRPELSGKSEMLLELLESIIESRQKVLVFTQFREMGEILSLMIEKNLGIKPMFLHGGCQIKERKDMVRRFQENERSDRIFLLSLKAAGTGLNLTAASHVIHYDLWWNPAVEAQATDRAYRIGQHQNVLVHRFITKNTFEERIDRMIQDKRQLADLTVASGENWIGRLSDEELRELFG